MKICKVIIFPSDAGDFTCLAGFFSLMWEILHACQESGRNSVQAGDSLSMRESWKPWVKSICKYIYMPSKFLEDFCLQIYIFFCSNNLGQKHSLAIFLKTPILAKKNKQKKKNWRLEWIPYKLYTFIYFISFQVMTKWFSSNCLAPTSPL